MLVWDVTGRLRDGRMLAVALTPRQLQDLWKALGQEDAAAAHQAIWSLVAGAEQSLPFLKKQLRAVPAKEFAAERRRIAQWIADLDDDNFAKRQQASAALTKLGVAVRSDLLRALAPDPSQEVRRRIEAILETMKTQGRFADELRFPRVMEVLEQVDNELARDLLKNLAQGATDAPLTQEARASLARLGKLYAPAPKK